MRYMYQFMSKVSTKIERQSQKENIRIGWTGAAWTRRGDLELIKNMAQWAAHKKGYTFVNIGHSDKHLSMQRVLELPDELVESKPIMSHKDYMESIDFDIGLAPLESTNFNQYKSPIKVIEYSRHGIPWIASRLRPMNNYVLNGIYPGGYV